MIDDDDDSLLLHHHEATTGTLPPQQLCRRVNFWKNGVPSFLRICVPCCGGCCCWFGGELVPYNIVPNFKYITLYILDSFFSINGVTSYLFNNTLSLSRVSRRPNQLGDTQMTVTLIHGFDVSFWRNSHYGSISRDSPVPVDEYPYY